MKRNIGQLLSNCLKQMSENKQKADTRKEYGTGIENKIIQNDGKKTIVCGLASIVCAFVGIVVRIFSFVGLIFGIVALRNGLERKGLALVGIICSAVSIAWPLVAYLVVLIAN